MLEVPKHLLPHLHYAEVGYIKGDTPEAQAFIDKNGLNTGALKEFWDNFNAIYSTLILIPLINDFLTGQSAPVFSSGRSLEESFKRLKLADNKASDTAILNLPQHNAELFYLLANGLSTNFSKGTEGWRVAFNLLGCLKTTSASATSHKELDLALWAISPSKDLIQGISNIHLQRLTISDYFCIKGLEFKDLNSNEIYILGRNGDGKTLILQAIVFALKYSMVGYIMDKKAVGALLQYLRENPLFSVEALNTDGEALGTKHLADIKNLYAYGAHRHQHTADPNDDDYDGIGFLTLFENNRKLFSPDQWLLDTRLKELEAKESGQEVAMTSDVAKSLLESLLNDEEEDRAIKIEIKGSERKVYYTERNAARVGFDQLSSGYQSVMVWVADLVARMSEAQPSVKSLEDFEAIVLVDEVGLHLHPKWEYTIMRKLRRHFPKIQFIVTTHSPVLLMGASDDAIIYKIQKEEGQTQIVGTIKQEQLSKMMANQIITSPLFGLDRTAPPNFDSKNATDSDFIEAKIHEAIRRRLAERNTLDDEEIMRWIQEELDNLPPVE